MEKNKRRWRKSPSRISPSARLVALVLAMTLNSPAAEHALEIRQRALVSAHAHNDYEHPRPLRDALAQGFNSVEADIWLVDGRLFVAHNLADVKSERTLQALYLDPLREHIRHNAGQVFTHATSFTLLIDLKSPAEPTYVALRELLLGYTDILTVHTGTETQTHALTIILTGNQPLEMMAAEPLRYTAIDGRLADLKPNLSPQLVPLISENWTQHFKWRGKGAFPAEEQIKLRKLVGRVHQQGRRLRFWAIPDTLAGWRELKAAGVDVIGSDDLVGLAKFLEATKR